jgi:hypothetical protein
MNSRIEMLKGPHVDGIDGEFKPYRSERDGMGKLIDSVSILFG